MTAVATRPGPNGRARPSLGDQLDRLDGILNGLADALHESVTAAVSAAVGKAVREAVETATRETALRPAPSVAETAEPKETPRRKLDCRLMVRSRAAARRVHAASRHVAGGLHRRLGTPLLRLLGRAVRARRFLLASVIAGVVVGTAAGFGGPLIGAVLGGLAGSVIALGACRPE
jgi:hypothetical protein